MWLRADNFVNRERMELYKKLNPTSFEVELNKHSALALIIALEDCYRSTGLWFTGPCWHFARILMAALFAFIFAIWILGRLF